MYFNIWMSSEGSGFPYKRQRKDSSHSASHKGSDSEDGDNKTKWTQLEHHAVTFPPAYEALPGNVKLRVKATKKDINLSLENEEVATWWADAEVTDFAAKDKVRENFWLSFKHAVASHPEVKGLEDLDFTHIKEHLDKAREEKKNRPTEVKKQELIERAEKNAKYIYCMIDGLQEKVSNFMIEPPGIFRGRGEHPHAGKIKNRVVPEYVTINMGLNEVIPACPIPGHSWKKVINNTEASWLCHFKDEKNTYAGSGKYLALAAESRLKGLNDKKKYERARRLKACIEEIRKDYLKNMESNNREN